MTDVTLYDEIGIYGTRASEFAERLKEAGDGDITLRVNSPGGDVYEGLAIMNQLRNHPGRVTAYVEGLAASAASFIVVGGSDELIMNRNSELMIHDAMSMVSGNAEEITTALAGLERASENIASIYAEKAGGDSEPWREAMRAETWFTAEEAVEAGLADSVGGIVRPAAEVAAMQSKFSLMNKFKGRQGNPPADLINKGEDMADTKELSNLLKEINEARDGLLSMVNSANELTAALLADSEANAKELADGVEDVEQPEPGEAQPEPGEHEEVSEEEEAEEPAEVEQPAEEDGERPEETVTIDAATYAELKAAAEHGWAAAEEKAKAERAAEVDNWISEGRISAALRSKAVAAIERDADAARATYGSNPKGTIPRAALGHAVDEAGEKSSSSHLSNSADASGLFGAPTF